MKKIFTYFSVIIMLNLSFTELVFGLSNIVSLPNQTKVNHSTSVAATGTTFCEPHYESIQEKIEISGDCILSVHNYQGNIRLIGWDKDYVFIQASKYSYHSKSELDQIKLSYLIQDDLLVEMKPLKSNVATKVHLTIYVPHSISLGMITTTDGKVIVSKIPEKTKEDLIITRY